MSDDRLRVLVVGPYPVDDAPVGGVESAVAGLVGGLAARHDIESVHVADLRPTVDRMVAEDHDGVSVHRLPAQRRLRLATYARRDRHVLAALLEQVRPHVVHGQGIGFNGLRAVEAPVPGVVTVHGMIVAEAKALSSGGLADRMRVRSTASMARKVVSSADAVISISHYDRAEVAALRPRKTFVIPNAVVPPCTQPVVAAQPTALYAGVITPRKNVAGLVRAFRQARARVPEARLILAGAWTDNAYRPEVENEIASCPAGSVEVLGQVDREGLAEAFERAGLLALFSHQETLPCVVGEAQLCGLPVVASRVGGLAEMIEDGRTGVLVADDDGRALSEALTRLLDSESLRLELGRAAAERAASRYAPPAVAEATIGVYRYVLGCSPREKPQ